MLEGCRLRGIVALYRDLPHDQTVTDYPPCVPNPADPTSNDPVTNTNIEGTTKTFTVPAGQRIVLDLVTAGRDPAVFPDPETVNPDRPIESYIHFGWGPHMCAGLELSRVAQTGLFKAIVGKKGLQRAPGGRGTLKSRPVRVWKGQVGTDAVDEVTEDWTGLRIYMTPDQSGIWPVPSTMKIRWEEE
jgi:Cytochrome P450